MASKKTKIHVALVVDRWFPVRGLRAGKFGGTQVHVQNLKKLLKTQNRIDASLFYGSKDNLLYRLLYPLIIFLDLLLYNRYHKLSLIHTHGLASALGGKLASLVLGIPIIHTAHSTHHLDQKKLNLSYLFEKIILTKIHYHALITLSSRFKNYHQVFSSIKEIDNGVDIFRFNQIRPKKFKEPTLMWLGTNEPSKGLPILKAAIQKVRKVIPNLNSQLIQSGTLSDDDLILNYKKSHVFVLPSLSESQPLTLFEAWAAKLPVVVTKVGEIGNLVKPEINGLVVEPDNSKQLANAIISVLQNPNQSKNMGKNGYLFVKNNYSWANTTKQVFSVYKDVLSSHTLQLTSPTFKPFPSLFKPFVKRNFRFKTQ